MSLTLTDSGIPLVITCVGILSSLLAFAVSAYTLYIAYVRRKYAHMPGPKLSSFFLGNIPEIRRGSARGKAFCITVSEWAREHGPVFKVSLLHIIFVIVMDASSVKHLLVTVNCPKSEHPYEDLHTLQGERFMGCGLVSERRHKIWQKKRSLINPAFNHRVLKHSADQFNACVNLLINKFKTKADGKTSVEMLTEFHRLTLDVIGKVGFGMEDNMIDQKDNSFFEANDCLILGLRRKTMEPFSEYNPFNRSFWRKVRECVRLQRETGREVVHKRLAARRRGEDVKEDDILGILLKASDYLQSSEFQMDDILDNFVTFYIAGQETTANLLAFIMMELVRHPEVLERVRTEIDAVLCGRTNVAYEDANKLTYTSQVVKEVLRMYPPAPAIPRVIEKEEVLAGVRVPAGSKLLIEVYGMGRQEKYFEDAENFNPDRFSDDGTVPPHAFIPFSLGPRNCIGQHFAQLEIKVTLAKILPLFDFTWVQDQSYDIDPRSGTLRPKDGCQLFISLRKI